LVILCHKSLEKGWGFSRQSPRLEGGLAFLGPLMPGYKRGAAPIWANRLLEPDRIHIALVAEVAWLSGADAEGATLPIP
jgi:hypothetical protein